MTRKRGSFYLWMALAISGTALLGFSFTYFGPLLRGHPPHLAAIVHLHGWSFFAFYGLLPVQVSLLRSGRISVHRTVGLASIALALVMVLTGLTVVGVQVNKALAPGGDPFWRLVGPAVFATLVVFTAFYSAAILSWRDGAFHKRLMILAATGALGAATFRILGVLVGFSAQAAVAGIFIPNTFVLVAMAHDRLREGRVHSVYRAGLSITLAVEAGMVLLVRTAAGPVALGALAWVGRILEPLY